MYYLTDGYTGNMVLKNIEGTAKSIGKMLKETFLGSLKRFSFNITIKVKALIVFK
jgi:fatty acid/phospholipid biosynthesis enzyme